MVKFSVIIPVYNGEHFIRRCVNSVLRQDYKNIELILINDGSTDSTDEICAKLMREDTRVVYRKQDNSGPSIARKTGLNIATGEYVLFVDADDYLEKGVFSEALRYCDKGFDIIEFGYYKVGEKGRKEYRLQSIYKEGEECLSHYIHQKNVTNYLCNKIIRKCLFDEVFFPKLYMSEDQCILAQVYYFSKKIVTLDSVYYNYYINSTSLCNSPFSKKTMDILKANDFIYDYLLKRGIEYASVQAIMGVNAAILVYNKLDLNYSGVDKKSYKKQIIHNYKKWMRIVKLGGVYRRSSVKQKLKWLMFGLSPHVTSIIRKRMKESVNE